VLVVLVLALLLVQIPHQVVVLLEHLELAVQVEVALSM
jgi:hypothetical protein